MKQLILYLMFGFLLFYPRAPTGFGQFIYDPGIVSSYEAPQDRYIFLDTIKDAVDFLNNSQWINNNAKLYEVKEIPLNISKELIKEETIKHYRNKWEVK